ncbi:MAG: ATP-dependent helicase DeaD [Thermoleophilaceae bacterium]|jgi:ATP-dependent RNA helicase DeaD|nr:ATP-dependent helicase DeaD [Thermoleophilaceae bacterium]
MTTFADLGLSAPQLEALKHLGYEKPTPIQEQAIPALLEGKDVIGQAQTGTGKTAAFGLPLLEYVDPKDPEVQALVLTPTRELCIQVTQALRAYGEPKGVDVVAIFGGAPIRDQAGFLRQGPQVVVGTVGRVMDMMNRHYLVLSDSRFVVLDEADEMLDLGFLEDVETILSRCPSGRQTSLWSATMPPEIKRLAEKRMYDPITIKVRAATLTIDTVDQFYVEVPDREKPDALAQVLKSERPDQAIVFVRTKIGADRLARSLGDKGVRVKALHGDMSQGSRDGVMIAFKGGRERLLVATDIAARGLDISGVSHVINYDVPNSPDVYVHRIGRTGRVGRSGRAITFITPKQRPDLEAIERHANTEVVPWSSNGGPPARKDPLPTVAADEPQAPAEAAPADAEPATAVQAAPEPRERRQPRRPRHTKPRRDLTGPRAKLMVGAGRAQGIEPADIVRAIVDNSHLEGEDVTGVRVLERFSFAEVPGERAEDVVTKVDGKRVRGTELRLEVTTR